MVATSVRQPLSLSFLPFAMFEDRSGGWLIGGDEANMSIPIDFNAANAVVEATHRYKEIFYDGD